MRKDDPTLNDRDMTRLTTAPDVVEDTPSVPPVPTPAHAIDYTELARILAEMAPVVEGSSSLRDLGHRLTSRKFLVTLLSMAMPLSAWVTHNVPGQTALILSAAISAAYILGESVVDATASKQG